MCPVSLLFPRLNISKQIWAALDQWNKLNYVYPGWRDWDCGSVPDLHTPILSRACAHTTCTDMEVLSMPSLPCVTFLKNADCTDKVDMWTICIYVVCLTHKQYLMIKDGTYCHSSKFISSLSLLHTDFTQILGIHTGFLNLQKKGIQLLWSLPTDVLHLIKPAQRSQMTLNLWLGDTRKRSLWCDVHKQLRLWAARIIESYFQFSKLCCETNNVRALMGLNL